MDEGQGPIVAWRMRFRGAQADALETKLQVTETIEELPKNGDRWYVAFPLAVRAGFSRKNGVSHFGARWRKSRVLVMPSRLRPFLLAWVRSHGFPSRKRLAFSKLHS